MISVAILLALLIGALSGACIVLTWVEKNRSDR